MRYKLFGRSGLRVSELSLGALTFGEEGGQGADKTESEKVFRAYVERGGNFIDTANKYNEGTSEIWCGEFIGRERDRFVIATKYSLNMRRGDPNAGGTHRKSMMQSVEASLKRLKTDYIDLYWLHQWDDNATPLDEVLRGLDDLVRQGKVLYLGISDTPAWRVAQANTMADLRGWSPFVGLQIEYSLIERTPERDLIPMAQALGLAITPWGVLGQSVLSGKYHTAADPKNPPGSLRVKGTAARITERNLGIARVGAEVAKEIGATLPQVAIAWLRTRSPQIIPILGARTQAQALDNLACLDITLPPELVRRLEEVSRIELGHPHDFLRRQRIVEQRWGGTQGRVEGLPGYVIEGP
ncbi:MAG: aldo/keto reductase [Deltaproteobacteria bacterium]|nr:aldo/keto reductase [Deltaproteobacteria bacterium]